MDKILVTGADGFIGRQFCRTLRQAGFAVKAAVRQAASSPVPDLEYVTVGDIGPYTDWTEALRGAQRVVHLAGRAHILGERSANAMAEYERVNILGTRRLAQMAAAAGIGRFLFLSSVKVNGEESRGRPFVETDPPDPGDAYGRSKWQAESALLHLDQHGELPVVIIRAPLVYGPGVRANFLSLIRWVDCGLPLPVAKIKNKRSLIGLGNLTNFLILCLQHPAAAGEIFLVSDQEDLSTPELVQRIGGLLGRSGRLLPIPYQAMSILASLLGKKESFQKLCHSLQVNVGKANELLRWQPPFSVNDQLKETIQWYKEKYKGN